MITEAVESQIVEHRTGWTVEATRRHQHKHRCSQPYDCNRQRSPSGNAKDPNVEGLDVTQTEWDLCHGHNKAATVAHLSALNSPIRADTVSTAVGS